MHHGSALIDELINPTHGELTRRWLTFPAGTKWHPRVGDQQISNRHFTWIPILMTVRQNRRSCFHIEFWNFTQHQQKEFKIFVSFLKREVKRGPRRAKWQAEEKIKIASQRQKYRDISYYCFFNTLSLVFLPFTVMWIFALRWQLRQWLSSAEEQKNPISSIYTVDGKMGRKEKKIYWKKKNRDMEEKKSKEAEKPEEREERCGWKEEAAWKEPNCGGDGGEGTGRVIVKYEIVLQKGRYWVKMW